MMKAFVLPAYGPPDQLLLTDIGTPVPAGDEVLVRVRAASVNPYDWHQMRGEPYFARLMPGGLGLRRPKLDVLGCDMAGQVEAAGPAVTGFSPGDDVYGLLPHGGFAEYVAAPASLLAPKPKNLSYEEAAAVPMAALTALQGLRDAGRLKPGQILLVNGASGGVGTFAVQLGRALGAEVTGVCSTRNVALARSLGATEVIDYTAQDFTRHQHRYDVVLDIAGSHPVRVSRRVLAPGGTFVVVGGPAGRWVQPADRMLAALALRPLVSQRMTTLIATGGAAHLAVLTDFIEEGSVTPVIDRRYPFEEIPAAIKYQEKGHARGKVVVTV
jgi:NADPH:quinone reductase-like Zn-dependent oxidoreductase